ncbi:hypothetical protein EC991_008291 [Linnemannia zychae]|nr:hypothetical protein EC991_008291 [Linnemannia zychae]
MSKKGFGVRFRGVFETQEAAIEHAKTFSIGDGEYDPGQEYVMGHGVYFDRKKKLSNYERVAVDDIKYFDK